MGYEGTVQTLGKHKRIALVAHDNQKIALTKWCQDNKSILKRHFLLGTGTTSRLIAEATGLPVKGYKSGPLGGDQQIGARIAQGEIDMLIFFWDPLEAQPHDPDVKALLRIAVVYDIPVANNRATADFLISSPYMNGEYRHQVLNYDKVLEERVRELTPSEGLKSEQESGEKVHL